MADHLQSLYAAATATAINEVPERATALLAEMTDALGIPRLDLFPDFRRDEGWEDCRLFFSTDPHWNDAGQRLAAGLTADAIARAGLLAPSAKGRRDGER